MCQAKSLILSLPEVLTEGAQIWPERGSSRTTCFANLTCLAFHFFLHGWHRLGAIPLNERSAVDSLLFPVKLAL